MNSSQTLKIGIPSYSIIRYYIISSLFPFSGKINIGTDYIEIPLDLKKYSDIFKSAIDSINEFSDNQRYKIDIPGSKNDNKIFDKLKSKLGLSKDTKFVDMFEKYVNLLKNINLKDFESELYPFYGQEGFSLPSIFNIELYGYTRGPFFQYGYKRDFKLSLHQMMLSLAGFAISRCLRTRIEKSYITLFSFPIDINQLYLFADQKVNSILRKEKLLSIEPIEALILWLIFQANIRSNIYLIGLQDPAGQKPAELVLESVLPLETILNNNKDVIDHINNNTKIKNSIITLISEAMKSGFRERNRKHEEELKVEDALRYTKLLFLAIQKSERDIRELMLRSSRIIINEAYVKDKPRTNISNLAREIAEDLSFILRK
jgi:hypothetical protein